MNKLSSLKKKKWLKDRQRAKKIKKQHNYVYKTHKGTAAFYLQQNLEDQSIQAEKEKMIEQKTKREILNEM